MTCTFGSCIQKCTGKGCWLDCIGGRCIQVCEGGYCVLDCLTGDCVQCNGTCNDSSYPSPPSVLILPVPSSSRDSNCFGNLSVDFACMNGTWYSVDRVIVETSVYWSDQKVVINGGLVVQSMNLSFVNLTIEGNFTCVGSITIISDQTLQPITVKGCANFKGNLTLDINSVSGTFSVFNFNCSSGHFDNIVVQNRPCAIVTYASTSLLVSFQDGDCSQQKSNSSLIIGLSVGLSLFVLGIGIVTFAIRPLRRVVMPFYDRRTRSTSLHTAKPVPSFQTHYLTKREMTE